MMTSTGTYPSSSPAVRGGACKPLHEQEPPCSAHTLRGGYRLVSGLAGGWILSFTNPQHRQRSGAKADILGCSLGLAFAHFGQDHTT